MIKFVDLHLCPPLNDSNQVREMFARSRELGYHTIGIPLPPSISQENIRQLQEIGGSVDVDFVTRTDLTVKTRRELLGQLRFFRRKFEIISVVCVSKAVARQAAKDRRVDLLSFPAAHPHKRFFDRAEAELASKASSCLEIDMASLLELRGFERIRLLSCLRREVEVAAKFDVPVIVSSGAKNVHLMRSPRDYVALTSLFDMAQPLAMRSLSEAPLRLVKRNREKLSPDYVAPGVRVVRRGKNCRNV